MDGWMDGRMGEAPLLGYVGVRFEGDRLCRLQRCEGEILT